MISIRALVTDIGSRGCRCTYNAHAVRAIRYKYARSLGDQDNFIRHGPKTQEAIKYQYVNCTSPNSVKVVIIS